MHPDTTFSSRQKYPVPSLSTQVLLQQQHSKREQRLRSSRPTARHSSGPQIALALCTPSDYQSDHTPVVHLSSSSSSSSLRPHSWVCPKSARQREVEGPIARGSERLRGRALHASCRSRLQSPRSPLRWFCCSFNNVFASYLARCSQTGRFEKCSRSFSRRRKGEQQQQVRNSSLPLTFYLANSQLSATATPLPPKSHSSSTTPRRRRRCPTRQRYPLLAQTTKALSHSLNHGTPRQDQADRSRRRYVQRFPRSKRVSSQPSAPGRAQQVDWTVVSLSEGCVLTSGSRFSTFSQTVDVTLPTSAPMPRAVVPTLVVVSTALDAVS